MSQKLALVPDLSTLMVAFGTCPTVAPNKTYQPVDGLFSTVSLTPILLFYRGTMTDAASLPSSMTAILGWTSE